MSTALVTGAAGLVGYAACKRLLAEGWEVVGLDNDSRARFFGQEASTEPLAWELMKDPRYDHVKADIRDHEVVRGVLRRYGPIDMILHAAAQPSHDWATTHIEDDFGINALGTLNLLLAWKEHCPTAPFCHISTSKIFGDNPNRIPYEEFPTRYDFVKNGTFTRGNAKDVYDVWSFENGIPETFPIDGALRSFFGVSKLSGDMLAQEFGKHFGMPVGVWRPGCVVGGHQKGAMLHGFLSYLCHCIATGKEYTIFGYKGKQVRDNLHADDLVEAMLLFAANPKPGEAYNIGGRGLDCSILEAIAAFEERLGKKAATKYVETPRTGDHRIWVSDTRKLERDYGWKAKRTLSSIFDELADAQRGK